MNRNGAGNQQVLQLNNSDTTAGTQIVKLAFGSSGATKASINAAVYGNDYLAFNTGSDTERMRLTGTGLGIGTSAPQTLLEISANNSAAASNTLRFTDTDTTTQIGQQVGAIEFFSNDTAGGPGAIGKIECNSGGTSGDGNLYFKTGFASTINTRLTIDSSGRVGIGTTSPSRTLDVVGTGIYTAFTGNTGATFNIVPGANGQDGVSLIHSYQSGTGYGPLKFEINGEKARIDSSGRLLVGTSSARTIGTGNFHIQSEGSGSIVGISTTRNDNNTAGANFRFVKTRGTAAGSTTIVQSGDDLGDVSWWGTDGTNAVQAAAIGAKVDGTPGPNDMPGRLVFSTTADGAASPTERLRIDSSGRVGIGTTSPSNTLEISKESNHVRPLQDGASGSVIRSFTSLLLKLAFISNRSLGFTDG
jgi:hypothetical protein